jgi:Putative beta barrel porin-7 (BBP7)
VRFVARLVLAIAAVAGSALVCWAQPPMRANTPGTQFPAAPTANPAVYNDEQPPDDGGGAWVADDETVGDDGAYEDVPGQLGDESFEIDGAYGDPYGDPYGGMGGDMGGECDCDCEECQAAGCDPDGGHRHGLLACRKCKGGAGWGLCGPLWCSDLWNDIHAHRRVYVQADYLSFWTKGNPLPPLVTTSPLGTPQSQAGVLPVSATTAILFGGDRVDLNQRNGGRINVGYWLVDGEFVGIEGQYLALEEQSTQFNAVSNFSGDPNSQILARPFFNVDPNLISPREDAAIIAFPDGFSLGGGTGTLDGSIDIRTTANLQSAGGLLRKLVWIDFTMQRRVDLLLGYRFLRVDDSVIINDRSTFIPSAGPVPMTEFVSQDVFSASNQFHGGEIGMKAQSHHGRLSLEFIGKCAFGNNRQKTYINGWNTIAAGGVTTENEGGLLAQPTNIGTHIRNVFAVLPEADANIRWDVTCNIRATIGYTFMYINRAQRSGDAINLTLNPTQINGGTLVGEAQPAFYPTDSGFWAHGATAGIEYRW